MVAGGGMRGCRGVCVIAGGHVWLLEGCAWLLGVCVVARGHAWLLGGCGCQGVCMVVGSHAWLQGACMVVVGRAMCGGGACVVAGGCMVVGGMPGCGGHVCMGYDEIRSMSERYVSYWNAYLLKMRSTQCRRQIHETNNEIRLWFSLQLDLDRRCSMRSPTWCGLTTPMRTNK